MSKPAPKQRKDGICALASCKRKLQKAKPTQFVLAAALAKEPFCSARCCRTYYGVVLSMPEQDERDNRPSTEGRAWAGRTFNQSRRTAA